MSNGKKKGSHASIPEIVKINDRLREVIELLPEAGMCVYKDEHTDHTIAAEFGVSHSSVMHIRMETFGKLKVRALPTAPSTEIEERVRQLEQRMSAAMAANSNLTQLYAALLARHDDLAVSHNTLAMRFNRVAHRLETDAPPLLPEGQGR